MIEPITPDMLHDDTLRRRLYPNLAQTFYWSTNWKPSFYVELARAGFISISQEHPALGSLLIAELQAGYAVLDWENLHRSNHVRRLMRSGRLEEEGIELRVTECYQRLLERLVDYHGPRTWLSAPYLELLQQVPMGDDPYFGLRAVELWSRNLDMLIAGEIGYTIGATYTSLSGFTTRPDPRWRHFGTLQMVMLADRLRERGYKFWNMGHTQQRYKLALGARVIPRNEFLERWLDDARNLRPDVALGAPGHCLPSMPPDVRRDL